MIVLDAFDQDAALAFLSRSRSRFCVLAGEWLTTQEDPVDLMFSLSRETGQALGPWETFRFCSLLGLTKSGAAHELGLDVLAEPLDESDRTPPVAQAFAIAHALRLNAPAEFKDEVLQALNTRSHDEVPPLWQSCARFVLGDASEKEAITAGLLKETTPFCVSAFEAATLNGDLEIMSLAGRMIVQSQDEEGAVIARSTHPILRAFETIRVLALQAFFVKAN